MQRRRWAAGGVEESSSHRVPSSGSSTTYAGFGLFDLLPDTCCTVLELLTPCDLGRLGVVASVLRWIPCDN